MTIRRSTRHFAFLLLLAPAFAWILSSFLSITSITSSPNTAEAPEASMIVRAADLEFARDAVLGLGGVVTHENLDHDFDFNIAQCGFPLQKVFLFRRP